MKVIKRPHPLLSYPSPPVWQTLLHTAPPLRQRCGSTSASGVVTRSSPPAHSSQKPLTPLTIVPPSTCGQPEGEISAEQDKCTSLPGAREQLIICKCAQKWDTNPHSAREISHTVLTQAHLVTPQSHMLFLNRHTHTSHSQCRIHEFLSMQDYSSLSTVCSWSTLETICHEEIIYCQNAKLQNIRLRGLSINSHKTIKAQAYSTA